MRLLHHESILQFKDYKDFPSVKISANTVEESSFLKTLETAK